MHNISNEVEFRQDRTTDYGVVCPSTSKKYPHILIMVKMESQPFLPKGNEDMRKSLDRPAISPDLGRRLSAFSLHCRLTGFEVHFTG